MTDEVKPELAKLEEQEKELALRQTELEKIKTETADYESKKDGLSKELERVQSQITAAREEKRKAEVKDKTFQEQFKLEQFQKAKEKFLKEFNLTDATKIDSLMKEYESRKSEAIDAEIVYKELGKAYVSLNSEELLAAKRKLEEMSGAAAERNAQDSSGAAAGGSGPVNQDVILDKDDEFAIQYSGIPKETYRELKKKGKIY